jgi:hypothetical protein
MQRPYEERDAQLLRVSTAKKPPPSQPRRALPKVEKRPTGTQPAAAHNNSDNPTTQKHSGDDSSLLVLLVVGKRFVLSSAFRAYRVG